MSSRYNTRSQTKSSQNTPSQVPTAPPPAAPPEDGIWVRWILFKPGREVEAMRTLIPRQQFEDDSQFCRPLFVEELMRLLLVATTEGHIEFWTPKEPLLCKDAQQKGWIESIGDFDAHFSKISLSRSFRDKLSVADMTLVHLVITLRDTKSVSSRGNGDMVRELKEFKRTYIKTQAEPAAVPPEDGICVQWILFKPGREVEAMATLIPRQQFEDDSQFCRPLFVKELFEELNVSVVKAQIQFWTPKEPLLCKDAQQKGWIESIGDFDAHFSKISLSRSFRDKLSVADMTLVHLVITLRDAEPENGDTVEERKEFKRYTQAVSTPGPTPSQGAKSSSYLKTQADEDQVIYDGLWSADGRFYTAAPPIQIYHPIFDDFVHLVNDPDVQPSFKDLRDVQDLMRFSSRIYVWDWEYAYGMRERVWNILKCDMSYFDDVIAWVSVPLFIGAMKHGLGEGDCDPTVQAGLNMKHAWVAEQRTVMRDKCCCPTFLIAGGGAWLTVMGGVFTDKVIIRRLTNLRWLGLSSSAEDSRVYHNAKVFVALRRCLVKLTEFYQSLDSIPGCVPNEPHPRYFPYPDSFTAGDGTLTRFRYLESLENYSTCVTFLAKVCSEPTPRDRAGDLVVVKFVERYGEEVHAFLAREGCAPALLFCGPLPAAKLSGVPPGPARNAPPGLSLRADLMHMVVMDYVKPLSKPPKDARAQIRAVLKLLHSEGYVFGDLREQNILFDTQGKIKVIDFNWCGRYDMNVQDQGVPDDVQQAIDQNAGRVQKEGDTYVRYPLSMSTVDGMWAAGMEPLALIRPQHDWRMFDKLTGYPKE